MKKTWTWSVTAYGLLSVSHDDIIAMCRSAGLAGIEGGPPLFEGMSDNELEALGAKYREAGLQIQTFHLPFAAEDDVASFYETKRLEAVEGARTWMERSALLGATIGIQHPTTNRFNVEAEGIDNYLRQLGKSLDVLLPVAERLNYTIALENLPPGDDGGRLSSRPEHFERFAATYAHPNLGFILDTGHALIAAGPDHADDFHEVMAPHMVAYHLADNAGDRDSHLAPGHGLVDWDKVFRRAAQIGYSGCMCIETPPFAHGSKGTYSTAAWKQMVDEADALVAAALGSAS